MKPAETLAELLDSGSERLLATRAQDPGSETAATDAAAILRGQLAEASARMLTPVAPLAEPTRRRIKHLMPTP